jgi:hypothetical protein
MQKFNINFCHPWHDYLYIFNVPKEKHMDFYSEFGKYLYSNDTEQYKLKAYRWILENKSKNY